MISQNANSNEVTGAYYDIETRIATLEAERNSLSAMLSDFTDYKDINAMLSVQERLYNVIEEIEALQTQLNLYDSQVELSTLTLTMQEVFVYTQSSAPTFGERVGDAFSESWHNFVDGCQDFAVGFIYALPTLLVLATIVIIALVIILKTTARYRKKVREERKASEQIDKK